MEGKRRSYRGLKICCGITAILTVIIAVVLVILYFTVFKPKEPNVITRSVALENIKVAWPQLFLNITLGVGVIIDNKNYGGFKYSNSTAYVSYRGNVIGEAPVPADTVPARKKHDTSTSVTIFANKLFEDDNFLHDFLIVGILNFTAASTLHGKASFLDLFKVEATIFTTCDISLFVVPQHAQSFCKSKVSF
ncbi:uncharacterized protein LOC112534765 [Ricinus communis]|uniref:Uncharacterized protein n=1 Tax=Ricinus communis TaxID=3988 RepID=B9RXQ2_RICCO|nr:uncharacterized protein LOC112534765 [Ricinus communis]EEF43908.1 conserved hypothetical protein [Ricinus communis]|eukprot:XP_025012999.1 uncharacterized protein LOC112534765 [Ricinus communis]